MELTEDAMYTAVVERNADYDGVFFVAVKTTGAFCRPTCPARPPRPENCEYFNTAKQAVQARYRPCKRCLPLSHPAETTHLTQQLIKLVKEEPEKRWRDADLRAIGVDGSTARRQFKQRFGMTFIEYARACRLGEAYKSIRAGGPVIMAQLEAGYNSGSGFRDAFSRILGAPPSNHSARLLFAAWIDTPLGTVTTLADEDHLYLLEYADRQGIERQVAHLCSRLKARVVPGRPLPIVKIESELEAYFNGTLRTFKTPLSDTGTPFQKKVWNTLVSIPLGETRSYLDVASAIDRPSAVRATASANGANPFAIIVPCHRVIRAGGGLGGYGGGLQRKRWLLDHEARVASAELPNT